MFPPVLTVYLSGVHLSLFEKHKPVAEHNEGESIRYHSHYEACIQCLLCTNSGSVWFRRKNTLGYRKTTNYTRSCPINARGVGMGAWIGMGETFYLGIYRDDTGSGL